MGTNEEKKQTRGGKRLGAGRKPAENARNIRASFMLSKKADEALARLCSEQGTTRNDVINKILEATQEL